jgi:hypothetical protein
MKLLGEEALVTHTQQKYPQQSYEKNLSHLHLTQIGQNTHHKTRKHSSSPNHFLRWLPKPHGLPIKEASKKKGYMKKLSSSPQILT